MAFPELFNDSTGRWQGEMWLWLNAEDPGAVSPSTAVLTAVVGGQFLELRYTWTYAGDPQEGLLLVGQPGDGRAAQAIWLDSWHMGETWMALSGAANQEGTIRLHGSYAAPTGPDWGWAIHLAAQGDHTFTLEMFNITPQGQALRAVQAAYTRQA